MLGIGYWTSKKEDSEGFMIANRKLSPLSAGISFAVSWLDPPFIFFVVAVAFTTHWNVIWLFVAATAQIVFLGFLAPKVRQITNKYKVYNLSELAHKNINKFTGLISAIIVLIGYSIWSAMAIYGGGQALSMFSGWSFEICVITISLIVFFYLIIGGFKASIYTDVFQYSWIVLLVIAMLIWKKPVGDFSSPEKIQGLFSEGWESNLWTITLFLITATNAFGVMARFIACKSPKAARQSAIISWFAQNIPLIIFAYLAYVVYTINPTLNGDEVTLYMFSGGFVSSNIAPLIAISFIGIILSTVDTYFLVMSTALMDNVFMSFKKVKKKDYRKALRVSILICAIASTYVALFLTSVTELFSFGLMVLGCGAPIFFATVFEKHASKYAAGVIALTSLVIHFVLYFSTDMADSTSVMINTGALILWWIWEAMANRKR